MAAPGHLTGAAILVAAGSGERLGADRPKAFVTVAGATLLEHAAARFRPGLRLLPSVDENRGPKSVNSWPESEGVRVEMKAAVVVAPAGYVDVAQRLTGLPAVLGGATRQQSVLAGLAALADADLVLVHDVARPFVPASVVEAVLAALCAGADAVVPVVSIHDTVRSIDAAGVLGGLVDRSTLVAMQTPQGFRRQVLVDAHERGAQLAATDDAALAENLGVRIVAVPGSDASFKVTTPADLQPGRGVRPGRGRATNTGGSGRDLLS